MITVKEKEMTAVESRVLEAMNFNNHEQVVFCNDPQSGLRAIIAIHNTYLGLPLAEHVCGITIQKQMH